MLGRLLFALVCVIIATGLLLPVYPMEVATPSTADAGDMLVADTAAPGCGGCGSTVASAGMPCDQAAPTPAAAREGCVNLTVYLVIRPLPATGKTGDPKLLRPGLPTI